MFCSIFDHNLLGKLFPCNSVYEQNYWININFLMLISYHYIMFIFIFFFLPSMNYLSYIALKMIALPTLSWGKMQDSTIKVHVLLNSRVFCKYWQKICSNGKPRLKLQQEKGFLVQCGHLLALMKNKAQKTLYLHWQIWVEEIDQTLRNALFDNNNK